MAPHPGSWRRSTSGADRAVDTGRQEVGVQTARGGIGRGERGQLAPSGRSAHALAGRAGLRDSGTVPSRRPPGGRTARTPVGGAQHGRVRLRRGPPTGARTVGLATGRRDGTQKARGSGLAPGLPPELNSRSRRRTVVGGRCGGESAQCMSGDGERRAQPEEVDLVSADSGSRQDDSAQPQDTSRRRLDTSRRAGEEKRFIGSRCCPLCGASVVGRSRRCSS